jgi:hypothetical protein
MILAQLSFIAPLVTVRWPQLSTLSCILRWVFVSDLNGEQTANQSSMRFDASISSGGLPFGSAFSR